MKKYIIISLCALCVSCFTSASRAQTINTIAGNGTMGFSGDNAAATAAQMSYPSYVTKDAAGNLYISGGTDQRVRKISPTGIITTIAGTGVALYTGDGFAATAATLNYPAGVAVDANGQVYIADNGNHCIRMVDGNGIIHTIAGNGVSGYTGDNNLAASATLHLPCGLVFDGSGNLYIADNGNRAIRKITMSTGIITTVAGNGTPGNSGDNGPATAAQISSPRGLTVDASGNVFFADDANYTVRKVTAATGVITTIGGTGVFGYSGDNGPATAAQMHSACVALDAAGNVLVTDPANYRIRKISTSGTITTIAGTGVQGYNGDNIPATTAQIGRPWGICTDNAGNIYFGDATNHRVRIITPGAVASSVSSHDNIAPSIHVYPNPSHGLLYVNIESPVQEDVKIIITDISGRTVKEISTATNTVMQVDLGNANGTYVLSLMQHDKHYSQKIAVVQ